MKPLTKTLETGRLLIRPIQMADVNSLHEIIYTNPDVATFFAGGVRSLEQASQTLAKQVWWNGSGGDQGFGFWAVLRKADNQIIGRLNYGRPDRLYYAVLDLQSPYVPLGAEVGYAFGQAYWGQGYAYEACHALIYDYIFPELRAGRIIDHVDAANSRSINLLKRLGFHIQPNHHPQEQNSVIGILENPLPVLPEKSQIPNPKSPNPLIPASSVKISFETARFTIRPLTPADFPALQQTLYADPAVRQSFGRVAAFEQVGDGYLFVQESPVGVRIREVSVGEEGFGSWGVVAKADGTLVGQLTLGPAERAYWLAFPGNPFALFEVELSYAFSPAGWREGGWGEDGPAEACRPLVDYALRQLRLERLVNFVPAGHADSLDLLTSLGFRLQANQQPDYPGMIAVLTA
jgi:RimJ/RimL family protein N-acetyltransferase